MTCLTGVVGSSEHAPSLPSSVDIVEAGDLPSGAVVLSAPSAVVCPPPTPHRAPAWTSPSRLIPRLPRPVRPTHWAPRPDEASPVPQMAVPTFRSPYAGGFLEVDPESSPRPWPSRRMRRSAPSCSPCGVHMTTLQDSLDGTDYRVAPPPRGQTALHHHRSLGSSGSSLRGSLAITPAGLPPASHL